jgi:polysaccharide export outer membrane protein
MILLLLLTTLQAPAAGTSDPGAYVVGPNDVLIVTVFNQPQLSGKFVVEADGTIAYPLVGRITVGGSGIRAVEDEIRRRLAVGYVKDPHVSVAIEQYRSQQIFVIGEVQKPGTLQYTGSMTLLEALARSGSTTDHAGHEAVIVRSRTAEPNTPIAPQTPQAANTETIRVDLQGLQTGRLDQNVPLRPGDTVLVPRAATVFVTGQVRTAGEKVIRSGMTVRQVLALAGGMTERGSTRRIQIIRQVEGKEVTLSAKLQDPVQPGDTIVVRERLF